jgi:hypothetical protein
MSREGSAAASSAERAMPDDRSDDAIVRRLSSEHGLSVDGVRTVLRALRSGGGTMAQFSHPDFGGMSQWSPGMSMVGDVFNSALKAKLDAVATELASHVRGSLAAGRHDDPPNDGQRTPANGHRQGLRDERSSSAAWWPANLGSPSAVGGQNDVRYAAFPTSRRLVVERQGRMTIYDTADHVISGVSQAQSSGSTLTFSSQHGHVNIDDLTVVGP